MQQPSSLPQMQDLVTIDEDVTNDKFGTYIEQRSIEQLLNYGLILLDKPPGPTSHEVVAWTKRILKIRIKNLKRNKSFKKTYIGIENACKK